MIGGGNDRRRGRKVRFAVGQMRGNGRNLKCKEAREDGETTAE